MKKRIILALMAMFLWATAANALTIVRLGVEYFPDKDRSRSISSGYIYVGEPSLDPTVPANQKTLSVQQENGTIVAVAQPLRTNAGGVPLYNGSPVTMLVDGNYSLLVQNSSQAQEYYVPSIDGGPVSGSLSEYGCSFATMVAQVGSVTETHIVVDCDPVTLSANLTIPSNITIEWRRGNVLDGLFTLTVNNLIAGEYRLVEDVTGLSLGLMESVNPFWYGFSRTATTSVNENSLDKTIASVASGQIITIPGGDYNVEDTIDINNSCTLSGYGVKLSWASDTLADRGIVVKVSNVNIYGLELDGPQFAALVQTQKGIYIEGTDNGGSIAPTYISNFILRDIKAYNWYYGLAPRFVENIQIISATVYNCYDSGIGVISTNDGIISRPTVYNITGAVEPYGIHCSKNDGDPTRLPVCKNIVVDNAYVYNIPDWEAIDTHGGENIKIINPTVFNCKLGVVITGYTSGGVEIGPKDCHLLGGSIVNETIATTDVGSGIILNGTLTNLGSGNTVSGTTVRGYGQTGAVSLDSSFNGSILIQSTKDSSVSDLVLIDSGLVGVSYRLNGHDMNVSNVNIKNITGKLSGGGDGAAFFFDGSGVSGSGLISANTINTPGATAFYAEDVVGVNLKGNVIIAANQSYDQNGGTIALEYIAKASDIFSAFDTWDPPSIGPGSSNSHTITSIPGCSSAASAFVSVNRDITFLNMSVVTVDNNTNNGSISVVFTNPSGTTVDLPPITMRYKIEKL